MAARIMATQPYCTVCRQVAHGMTVRIELCSQHGAAADLLLALTRIRSKGLPSARGREIHTSNTGRYRRDR
jgi:hypothetical protein